MVSVWLCESAPVPHCIREGEGSPMLAVYLSLEKVGDKKQRWVCFCVSVGPALWSRWVAKYSMWVDPWGETYTTKLKSLRMKLQ